MAQKYYALLYRPDEFDLTFPVKAPQNVFDGMQQYAGGYPAMFGGTDKQGRDNTLTHEVSEESRGTLTATSPFERFFTGQTQRDTLEFYWTKNWQPTGLPWATPKNRDEGEMLYVVTVPIADVRKGSRDEILSSLIHLSRAPGGSHQQHQEFMQSETAKAFVEFLFEPETMSK